MMGLKLPLSRIKTIMKCSPDVENIRQDALYLTSKAAELFIELLTVESYEMSEEGSSLEYDHIAEVVQSADELIFLREIMPRRVQYGEFLKSTRKQRRKTKLKNAAVKSCCVVEKGEHEEQTRNRLLSNKAVGGYYSLVGL